MKLKTGSSFHGLVLACLPWLLAFGQTVVQADSALRYEKKATWPETMLAARAGLLEQPRAATGTNDPRAVLWQQMEKDFPASARAMKSQLRSQKYLQWFDSAASVDLEKEMIEAGLRELGEDSTRGRSDFEQLRAAKAPSTSPQWLTLYEKVRRLRDLPAPLRKINVPALRLAVEDLIQNFQDRYPRGREWLNRIAALEKQLAELEAASGSAVADRVAPMVQEFQSLQRDALLANPLLDFDRLLLVRRQSGEYDIPPDKEGKKRKASRQLGLPQNWQGNCALPATGYSNEIAVLSPVSPQGTVTTFFRPTNSSFVGDVDLHFDADRMLFSMPGANRRWGIWEIKADASGLRQISPTNEADVNWYDPCYLPDGRILFAGTAVFQGVPCVGGGDKVANLYLLDPASGKLRQVTFDQEHNWCPTVLNNGRILYARWEYTDTPHYFTRLLFHMNPDGTEQSEFYGSNSYWPNSIFYARPIPGHPTKVVAVISGHHGSARMGELVIFDPAKGRHESGGAVQRIPGYGQSVQPIIRDTLVDGSWPKFLHPYPLNDKYFLVSCKPSASADWGVYLVDIFDTSVLLHEEPGFAMFEPVPFRKTPTPPVIPDKVDLAKTDARIYVQDIYAGPGLAGVPRGSVKKLRVFEYHFAYAGMGGHINIGIDGPWDVHRILGTVPVESDGSVMFTAPANHPLAIQPLDAEGKALQVMRSWFTAMPGETVSCVGCHEKQNNAPAMTATIASTKAPVPIQPWYGEARGFSFPREVQPVLDQHCVRCHDGKPRPDGRELPNFADATKGARGFTKSYLALHPFVRRPGPESDYHLQNAGEWHADTSELVQMLQKGHHGVKLDAEGWDRLITWIDLNVPDHGTWGEHRKVPSNYHERRMESFVKYANRTGDPEAYPTPAPARVLPGGATVVSPQTGEQDRGDKKIAAPTAKAWPFESAEAARRQTNAGAPSQMRFPLADKLETQFTFIPAGEFVMGSADGFADEFPPHVVRIEKPFYIGAFEVSNDEYAAFDPTHDSRVISSFNKDQSNPGEIANRPRGPVIRVSWQEAMAYCEWLSHKIGRRCTLPTEAQWEYACRAGTATPWSYGGTATNFAQFANLADARVESLCRGDSPKWIPACTNVNDGSVVTDNVGRYLPNAWGLRDMHGNAAEWTLSTYQPYPYAHDGRDSASPDGRKVVRGGSFYDRPQRATSSFRQSYPSWQRVWNVGFRVICDAETRVAAK